METNYDEAKFTEMVLLVADRLRDDPGGGATKLNKALYYAEFGHVRAHGKPISGAEFFKLPQGPAPRRLLPVRQALEASGAAVLVADHYLGLRLDRLVPKRKPDVSRFSADELASIEQAVDAVRGLTGTQVSDLSHEELGWQMVGEKERIPYETAYLRNGEPTEQVRARALELSAHLGFS